MVPRKIFRVTLDSSERAIVYICEENNELFYIVVPDKVLNQKPRYIPIKECQVEKGWLVLVDNVGLEVKFSITKEIPVEHGTESIIVNKIVVSASPKTTSK